MASEVLKRALIESAQEEFFNINLACENEKWEPSVMFLKQMDELLQKTQHRKKHNIKYALLAAAVIFLFSAISVLSVAQVREKVINIFKEYYYTHFEMEYGYENAGDIITGQGIEESFAFTLIPDGYSKTDIIQNEHSVITVYENKQGDSIVLSQGDGMTKSSVDAERLEKTEIVRNGIVYEVYSEEGYLLILWNTDKYTFSIDHFGELSAEYLINMAETMRGEES